MNCLYDNFIANQEVGITGKVQRIGISTDHATSFHLNGNQFQVGHTNILEFTGIEINSFYFDTDIWATITYLR